MKSFVLFFLVCCSFSCTLKTTANKVGNSKPATKQQDSLRPAKSDTLTIAMCGDIMMGTTYPTPQLPPNDGENLFSDTKPYTTAADLSVGNLEGAICDGGTTTKKGGRYSYAFRMPTNFAPLLKDAGYDFLSMANNHAFDFGETGILSTEQALDAQDIRYAGIKGRTESVVIEKNGVRYGICAFGHNSYTLKHTDFDLVKRILDELRSRCDILIVSFHGGAEGRDKRHLPYGQEIFLGENRGNLRNFAHFCIDNGADIVYGHGPHVVRAVEVYNRRFIAYSLGNFCTPYGISLAGISGYAPIITIRVSNEGLFIDGKIHSFVQQRGIGPRKDLNHLVVKEIKELTETDIKNQEVTIDDEGNIK